MKIRHFAEACKSIYRNKMMSLTSAVIVAACLFTVLLMFCLAANIDAILSGVESDIQISAFIDDDLSADNMNALLIAISGLDNVDKVIYISKEENLDSWQMTRGMDLGDLPSNPLRAYYEVYVNEPANIQGVVDALEQMRGLATITNSTETISSIVSLNNVIRVVCLVIIGILGIIAIIIITNTIKLTIDNRKTEIGIMKYIGSTNWFIRWPFVLEGMILGLVGAAIPVTLFVVFYDGFMQYFTLKYLFFMTNVEFSLGADIFPVVAPVVLLIGGVIGTLASLSSIRKHLNV